MKLFTRSAVRPEDLDSLKVQAQPPAYAIVAAAPAAPDLGRFAAACSGIAAETDPDALLEAALNAAAELTGAEGGFACQFAVGTKTISRGVFRGLDKAFIRTLLEAPQMRDLGAGPVVFDAPRRRPMAAVGLTTQWATPGVLVLSGVRPSQDERELLRALGAHAATALGAGEARSDARRREADLESVVDAIPVPVVLLDSTRRVSAVNPAAEEVFGVSAAFARGASVQSTLSHARLERLLAASGDATEEVDAGTPVRTFEARATDVGSEDGSCGGRLLVMEDVSTLRRAARSQRDFVAMLTGDLRGPLSVVKGFARTLRRRGATMSAAQLADVVSTLDRKASQMERLIDDLAYASEVADREVELREQWVDVATLVEGISEELLGEYRLREVEVDVPGNLRWWCDETKLALVLRHLIDNALKFSDAPEPVTVSATATETELRINVVDRGIGIVSSDLPHLFERFRRIDADSTRRRSGIGVGLYLCSRLVRAHGGELTVDSTWGRGSRFTVALPPGRHLRRIGHNGDASSGR